MEKKFCFKVVGKGCFTSKKNGRSFTCLSLARNSLRPSFEGLEVKEIVFATELCPEVVVNDYISVGYSEPRYDGKAFIQSVVIYKE